MKQRNRRRNPNLALAIGLLSILSVINTILTIFANNPDIRSVIVITTEFLSIFFVINLTYRLAVAESKVHYLVHEWGWVDALACIPFFQISWLFRGLRAYLTFNHLRLAVIRQDLEREEAEFTLFIAIFMVILILESCSVAVLIFEGRALDANIHSGQDALWWAYVTISSVGYGDKYPVTSGGRVVGTVLMTAGVAIYATLGGYLAQRLINRRNRRMMGRYVDSKEDLSIATLDDKLKQVEVKEAEMLQQLDRIEQLLRPSEDREGELPTSVQDKT